MAAQAVKTVRVVAGVMKKDGLYLICRRKADTSNALEWEFPGGKVEPGETDEQALERELFEELGIRTHTGRFLREIVIKTPDRILLLEYYETEYRAGQIRCIDCADLRFAEKSELCSYHLSEADRRMAGIIADQAEG